MAFYIRSDESGKELWLSEHDPRVVWDIDQKAAMRFEDAKEAKSIFEKVRGWRPRQGVSLIDAEKAQVSTKTPSGAKKADPEGAKTASGNKGSRKPRRGK